MILPLFLELLHQLQARLKPALLCLVVLVTSPDGCAHGQAQSPRPLSNFASLTPLSPAPPFSALPSPIPAASSPQSASPLDVPPALPFPPPRRVFPAQAPIHSQQLFYPYAGVFCGVGASTSSAATKPTFGCGAGFSFVPLPIFFEVGVMGPQANRSYLSGYLSTDINLPLARTSGPILPEVLFGYSRLFETGHALDYGLALVIPRDKHQTDLRLEVRDYWTFANPNQHNIMLRLGLISPVTD